MLVAFLLSKLFVTIDTDMIPIQKTPITAIFCLIFMFNWRTVGTGMRKMMTSVTMLMPECVSQSPCLLMHLSVGEGFQKPDTGTQKKIVAKTEAIP